MNRIALSLLAVAITATAGSAFADHQDYQNDPSYYDSRDTQDYHNGHYVSDHPRSDRAQVIRVDRINGGYSDSGYQRQECWSEQTNDYQGGYYRDSNNRLYRGDHHNNTAGTLLGALVGGALGNTVGKGDGRTAATIGGAVIGGVVGNNISRNNDARNNDGRYGDNYDQYQDNSGVVTRCRIVTDNGGDPRYDNNNSRYGGGYSVTYRYAGQIYHAYSRQNPGRYIRVLVDVRPQDEGNGYGGR